MPRLRRVLALSVLLLYVAFAPAPLAGAGSTTVVISQVYGGGGNSGATFRNDFIELHNRGTSAVSLNGWSVQYASSVGNFSSASRTNLPNVVLQPGQYFLVQEAAGAGGSVNLPTPDATGSIAMAATAGKVALVNSTTVLATTGCPIDASVIDFVGYGTGTNCFEGTGPTATLSNTTAAIRAGFGCTDTDSNSTDFSTGAPNPHNTASIPGCSFPSGSGSASPDVVSQGASVMLTVIAKPGTTPTDTNLSVTGDLSSIGGAASQLFTPSGSNLNTGEQTFTWNATVGAAIPQGSKSIPITVTDGLHRQGTTTIALAVRSPFITRIHDIQGNGSASPVTNTVVTTEGIVTGTRSNGFFIQDLEANYDADAASSEGVFVFTSSAPGAGAIVGNEVLVIGTVSEFIPSADPYSPPTTEIGTPFVAVESTGVTLPSAVGLTAADLNAAGSVEQLERLEGMRVSVSSITVVAPTGGTVNETAATSTSSGVFYGVLPGVDRPFREPGIEVFEPVPPEALSPPSVPRFDANPERIRVDSDAIGGVALDVTPGATVTNLVGPLDYSFRSYTIDLDPASPAVVTGVATSATAARAAAAGEFTIGSANLERFFDTTNDPTTSDPVLTPTALANRLNKVSLQIRSIMRSPDIIGVEEVENLSTLQAIASKVNSDAIGGGDPNPGYVAYLEEGNDIGGIDSGFLVKSSRVTVLDVQQQGLTTEYVLPDNTTALLNDRPPLILRAQVHEAAGDAGLPVTVIVNHLRSLSAINDALDGGRVRAKRRAQAEYLATLIHDRQLANPDERIVSVGDYNAFQFSDGYVDSIGTIKGTPTPPENVTLASADLVDPDLVDLVDMAPSGQRYSFVFDGNAQELDHVIVTPNILGLSDGLSYGRNNADFPETFRNDPNSPVRVSDHDPVVAYFAFPMDTTTTVSAAPPTTTFGQPITFTATVSAGGTAVTNGTVSFSEGATTLAGPIALDSSGTASFTTAALTGGAHTVTAAYSGAGALQPSMADVVAVVVPAISINDVRVREADGSIVPTVPALFTVTLSAPSTETVTVSFATANITALGGSDYVSTSGPLLFAPGETTQTIAVDVNADPMRERVETFSVNLSSATNATIADGVGIGSIVDLREPPLAIRTFAPGSRAAGTTIIIIGTGLTDVTNVTFNGTPAGFTILSSTAIRATVPATASTGPITVMTPTATATSAASFVVLP
jgi:predicted extracellular nuclease